MGQPPAEECANALNTRLYSILRAVAPAHIAAGAAVNNNGLERQRFD